MAIAFQSVQTATGGGASSVTITKPVSLAVGDLMVAHITNRNDPQRSITTLSGWTIIGTEATTVADGSNVQTIKCMYKIADSGDVAATNFTFSFSGAATHFGGAIFRITGHNSLTPIDAVAQSSTGADDTPAYSGVDPTYADSFFLFLTCSNGASGGSALTTASYAFTTDNPSWTEAYDLWPDGPVGSDRLNLSGAYANRSAATATGNATCTFSGDTPTFDSVGFIIAIRPIVDTTITPTTSTLTFTLNAPTITVQTVVTPSTFTLTFTLNEPTRTGSPLWDNLAPKNAISPTNTSKNVASPSNVSKSSTTWTNTSKS